MKMTGFVTAAVAALLLAGTAGAQTADKKTPAKPAAAKPMAKSMVADKLMANENKLIDAVRAKDVKAFSSLVKAGSWSIDENGPMPVDDFIKALGDPKADVRIEMLKASDMKVVDIDATAAIVMYTAEQKGSFMGMPFPPKVYATTVWANHGGAWHAVFHQESTAAPPPKK